MTESARRAAVCVAVDPFLLRSALYHCLASDPRFTALLYPPGEDATVFAHANHVDAVLASAGHDITDIQVLTVAPPGPEAQPGLGGDLAALLDLIHLTLTTGGTSTLRKPSATPVPHEPGADTEPRTAGS